MADKDYNSPKDRAESTKLAMVNSLLEPDDGVVQRAINLVQEVLSERQYYPTGSGSREQSWEANVLLYMGVRSNSYAGSNPFLFYYSQSSNGAVATYSNANPPWTRYYDENVTLNAVIAQASSEVSRTPEVEFTPVESPGSQLYWFKPESGMRFLDAIVAMTPPEAQGTPVQGADGQMAMMPMDPMQVEAMALAQFGLVHDQVINPDPANEDQGPTMRLTLRQYTRLINNPKLTDAQPVTAPDPITGAPVPTGQMSKPILDPYDDFYVVDDEFCAENMETVVAVKMAEANAETHMNDNTLAKIVFGHQWFFPEWDAVRHRLYLSNPYPLMVYPDTTKNDLPDFSYLVADFPIDESEAISRYPWLTMKLEKGGQTGNQFWSQQGSPTPPQYAMTQFKRKLYVLRVMWERNKAVPMHVWDAMNKGLVLERQINQFVDPMGAEYEGPTEERPVIMTDPASGVPMLDPNTGQYAVSHTELHPPGMESPLTPTGTRTELYLVSTGEVCQPPDPATNFPGSDNWPTEFGVRQTSILMNTGGEVGCVVSKIRAPFDDIPGGWNKNIPEIGGPYGQGEPQRLSALQRQIDDLWTTIGNICLTYRFPMELWPKSAVAAMTKQNVVGYSKPGRVVSLDDQLWMEMIKGNRGFQVPPPQIPPSIITALEIALREHDRLSGNTAVNQGNLPAGDTSGRAIALLQSQAQSVGTSKASHTQSCFKQVIQNVVYAITWFMPDEQWRTIFSGIPWLVLQDMIGQLRRTKYNIRVDVFTGRGIVKAMARQEAMENYMGGGPQRLIPQTDAMKQRGVRNPRRAQRQIQKENEQWGLVPPQSAGQAQQQATQDAAIQARGEAVPRKEAQENSQQQEGR